ncbi:thrombospondin type 3 repeat-containing protein [uncultured Fibrella sp.]|uniref:thrombospondin type 3 repeat-containing protein n=1 Tax=uncultured Fibrella sp. TaxID=1284596 RepID=UPI0035CAEC18
MTQFLATLGGVLLALLLLPPDAAAQTPPCDYTTTTITLNSAGGAGGGTVRYVLADETGQIRQVSSTPTFSGLTGSHSYTALAISHDGTATGLTAGNALSAVSASCYAWSAPLVLRVCVADPDSDGDGVTDTNDRCPGTPLGTPVNAYGCPKTTAVCSYTTTTVTLNAVGGSGNGTVRYILADSVGIIRQIGSTPTFSGLTSSKTYMALAIAHDGIATGLTVGQSLSGVSASCYNWSDALVLKVCVDNDEDKDGVIDGNDRCPGTPLGMPVNTYGCPTSLTVCSYTGTSFSLVSANGAGGGTVQYVLADSVGTIVQVNNQPVFSGLTRSKTYMALAISHDGSVMGLTAGNALSAVSATCFDWSDAVVVRVCEPTPTTCDYTIGDVITLKPTGGTAPTGTLTRYALVNAAGQIIRLEPSASFATNGLTPGPYTAYALVYTDDGSLVNLQTGQLLTAVRANCLALSAPLPLSLCPACAVTRCIPIMVTKVR